MKRYIVIYLLLISAFAALPARANTVSFKISYYLPTMKSDFWDIEFQNMTFSRSDFLDSAMGLSYDLFLTRELSLLIGIDTFTKSRTGNYEGYALFTQGRNYYAVAVDQVGDISHSLHYSVTPVQFSLKVTPLGRRVRLIPYFGAGGGLYIFSLRMLGDLVDFDPAKEVKLVLPQGQEVTAHPVSTVTTREGESFGRIAFGYQVFGGLMYPIGNRITVEGEFKYGAAKAAMHSFTGFQPLDVGGMLISLGINYWF